MPSTSLNRCDLHGQNNVYTAKTFQLNMILLCVIKSKIKVDCRKYFTYLYLHLKKLKHSYSF